MISVQVRYFASLREHKGCSDERIQLEQESSARDIGRKLELDVDGKTCMVAVNRTSVDPGHMVKDGDEVAFFPPVTGG